MAQPITQFVDTFYSNIRQHGFAKPNRYIALIQPNEYVLKNYLGFSSNAINSFTLRLAATCHSAAVPNPTFFTHDFGITSPQTLIPYALNSNNASGISLDFYCLNDMFEKEVFHAWMNGIVNKNTRHVDYYNNFAKNSNIYFFMVPHSVTSFEEMISYMSDRPTPSLYGPRISGVILKEIYPFNYSINGGQLNHAPANNPMGIKVDFMFREMIRFGEPDDSDMENFNQNVDNELLSKSLKELRAQSLKSDYEKAKTREKYNNSRNIQKGVDGKLLNPETDGLPNEYSPPNFLTKALTFVEQLRGFGIVRL